MNNKDSVIIDELWTVDGNSKELLSPYSKLHSDGKGYNPVFVILNNSFSNVLKKRRVESVNFVLEKISK